ncbi:CPBP family intramembrane glutamic endopeptidase [Granulicella sp. L46]|uniref:CPBP family intramembrane glutamic endopeptidase n=1 Tax=Granulicella sp. L46 TaxID=1641865 RepID=UPI00131E5958|nr:type II CAAX endopeptidase family protein [Granulicella sp. L46]
MSTERLSQWQDRTFFFLEALIVFGLFWADIHHWRHVVIFSKTPYLLVLGWISLRVRGVTWSSIGFSRPTSWRGVLAYGVAAGLAMECLELFVTQPFLMRLLHTPPDLSVLSGLRGNVILLAVVLLLTWTLAAFGEELVWRGYILNRVADVISVRRLRWPVAVLVSSAVFGLAHFDQGWTGVIENAIDGALLAGLYFASGRNLWVPIIAHGVTDSLDSLLIFSGHYPTM